MPITVMSPALSTFGTDELFCELLARLDRMQANSVELKGSEMLLNLIQVSQNILDGIRGPVTSDNPDGPIALAESNLIDVCIDIMQEHQRTGRW